MGDKVVQRLVLFVPEPGQLLIVAPKQVRKEDIQWMVPDVAKDYIGDTVYLDVLDLPDTRLVLDLDRDDDIEYLSQLPNRLWDGAVRQGVPEVREV